MTIDRETAKSRAQRYLSAVPRQFDGDWVILDHRTQEFDVAWMFWWTHESLAMPDTRGTGTVGNYPILVDKSDGTLYVWTLLEPLDRLLETIRHDKSSAPRLSIEGLDAVE